MKLFEEPFNLIKSGKKTIEIRLNDEKRRKIAIGDLIEFTKLPDERESLKVKVLDLLRYDTFKDMYRDIPFKDFGREEWSIEEMLNGTYSIYSIEQENEWGVLGIKIKLIDEVRGEVI